MTTPANTTPYAKHFIDASRILRDDAPEEADGVSQSIYALVAQQPFFDGFHADQLQLFAESAMIVDFEPGEAILKQESPADRFYLILEGKAVLGAELEARGIIPVQILGRGDCLGWSWLFPPNSMRLSARALALTRTIFFQGTRLREQCEQDHELGFHLMKSIAEVAIQRLRLTQQRLVECTATWTRSTP